MTKFRWISRAILITFGVSLFLAFSKQASRNTFEELEIEEPQDPPEWEQLKKPVNWSRDCLPRQFDAKKLYLQALTTDVRKGPTLLIGVMSMVELANWRDKTRNALRPMLDHLWPRVTLRFVVGKPENFTKSFERELTLHNDIMILNKTFENMNKGKTYYYLMQAYEDYPHDYIMKTDHDALINLPLYLQYLPEVPKQTYFGRAGGRQCNFMVGGGYTVSRDVLSWIHTLNINDTQIQGSEDMLIPRFFGMLGFAAAKLNNWIHMTDHFGNFPHMGRLKQYLMPNYTLIAHQLKKEELWDYTVSAFTKSELWRNVTSRDYK